MCGGGSFLWQTQDLGQIVIIRIWDLQHVIKRLRTEICWFVIRFLFSLFLLTQSAEAVEYTHCMSAKD